MVIADSGPLIALVRLDLLRLLPAQFDVALVPDVVLSECTVQTHRPGARAILAREAGTLQAAPVAHAERVAAAHRLDPGEAAALVLAQERSKERLPIVFVREGRDRRGHGAFVVADSQGLRMRPAENTRRAGANTPRQPGHTDPTPPV